MLLVQGYKRTREMGDALEKSVDSEFHGVYFRGVRGVWGRLGRC